MTNADNSGNDNDVVETNDVPPSQLTTEELEEAVSSIIRAAF